MGSDILDTIKEKLSRFGITDYFRELSNLRAVFDLSRQQSIRIAILRSYTCETVEVILKLQLMVEGYYPELLFGGFNQYAQEILDEHSELYHFKPEVIILLIRIEDLLPDFVLRYGEKSYGEWGQEFENLFRLLDNLFHHIATKTNAQLLVQSLYLSCPYFGIYVAQHASGQAGLLAAFNRRLQELTAKYANLFIWDFGQLVAKVGYAVIYDPKMWYIARNPYSQNGYIRIVTDLMRYLTSIIGKVIKCIVLDLDNTLWGGVIGEDGIQGIALGNDYPGNCYVDFQLELLKLYQRGIILAINSKNNAQDVLEVLDQHPHMVLRRKHFAAMQINWQDKLSNLQRLAEELNIGMDSMVFIDDNPVECELVRKHCNCCVIQTPAQPYLMPQLLISLSLTENLSLTDEDLKKGEIYRVEVARKKFAQTTTDLDEFLRGLNMRLEIKPVNEFTVVRAAQLTQKTNQFNLTTKRYQESDIMNFINSDKHSVFVVSAQDRFGDYGNIGVFILELNCNVCVIDTFLLSCRVIGRTVEQSMLAFIADFCRKRNTDKLLAEFIPSSRNMPAKNFYLASGFNQLEENKFIADLSVSKFSYSPFISLVNPENLYE